MTRINVVPPEELCDQHLLAEHRELTRIPNAILKGRYSLAGAPAAYTLGKGHVKFFYDKLTWLQDRYDKLQAECLKRGFAVTYCFINGDYPIELCKSWEADSEAIRINRLRIADRLSTMKRQPRWSN